MEKDTTHEKMYQTSIYIYFGLVGMVRLLWSVQLVLMRTMNN